jgi:hypothetical protein
MTATQDGRPQPLELEQNIKERILQRTKMRIQAPEIRVVNGGAIERERASRMEPHAGFARATTPGTVRDVYSLITVRGEKKGDRHDTFWIPASKGQSSVERNR